MFDAEKSPSSDFHPDPRKTPDTTKIPLNQEDFARADLSGYSFEPPPVEPPEFMRKALEGEGKSWISGWPAKAIAAIALSPAFASAAAFLSTPETAAQAAPVSPAHSVSENREKAVIAFAQESWQILKERIDQRKSLDDLPNADSLWNNIQAVLHVTDSTNVAAMDKMRIEIIERGATNPAIPARIVHGALYTMAVTGHQMNLESQANTTKLADLGKKLEELSGRAGAPDAPADLDEKRTALQNEISRIEESQKAIGDRKASMSAAAIPYLGKYILDTTTREGRQERFLVSGGQMAEVAKGYPFAEPYPVQDFDKLAAYVLGQVADKTTLEKAAQEILSSGNDVARRNALMDIFLYSQAGTPQPAALVEQSKVWVFGRDQIQAYKRALEEAAAAPAPSTEGVSAFVGTKTPAFAPAAPTIPGVPMGAKAGTLMVVQQIDREFVAPRMTFPFSKDAEAQKFVADNILYLVKQGDQLGKIAAVQWFAMKHPSESMKRATAADATVLQALSMVAQEDPKALEVLRRVGASFPGMVIGEVMMAGNASDKNTPASRAATELVKALQTDAEGTRKWMVAVAERKAPMLWPEGVNEEIDALYNTTRDAARMLSLRAMASLDGGAQFVDTFRSLVDNPFARPAELEIGMIGLALSKDRGSIDLLMSKANQKTLDGRLRVLALEAALFVDTPSHVPAEVLAKAAGESPFSPSKLRYFFPQGGAEGEKAVERFIAGEISNPFHARLEINYQTWLDQENGMRKLVADRGGLQGAVTEAEKLDMMLTLVRRELGGSESILAERGRDPEFKRKYLEPLLSYLETGSDPKTPLDMGLAGPIMMVLDKSGYTEAGKLFAHMAAYPERYVTDRTLDGTQFGMKTNATNIAVLKVTALQTMGGTVDLTKADDPAATVLHRVSRKNSSRIYRDGALQGLKALADRYDAALKTAEGAERDALLAARAAHGKECVGHLQYHRQLLETPGQGRLTAMWDEFKLAKMADRFGATKELLAMADKATSKDLERLVKGVAVETESDMRPLLVRSVMHALRSNGRTADDIKSLGFDADTEKRLQGMFTFVNNQEYWLGGTANRPYTGKGTEVAVFDVGYVLPLDITGDMKKQLIYPDALIKWSDLAQAEDVHPTMVAWTIHQAAKDAKIRTYNVSARLREVEFRPAETQDALFRAFEDLAELQMAGRADVDVANYSFGFPNIVMNDAKARAEFVDQMSACMELLSKMDVKHAIAAANAHGANPAQARFAGLGEVNNLGLRFHRNDTEASRHDGVFIAAAHDAYTGRLAEFSSKLDELRPEEAVRMRSFQGVNSMLPDIEDGKWVMIPGNGTSFASPNQAAMLLWGVEAVESSGVTPLTLSEWQGILDRSIQPLPGREAIEGGDLFDVRKFLEELRRVTGGR